jgi:N-acetyl-anhydromuramyl-L-alanine amidase AmpD
LPGSRHIRLVLLACALAAAVFVADATSGARLRVLVMRSDNYTDSNRTAQTIDQVVVHVTEGSFLGSVRWLRNRRSHGSSHYIVSRRGEVIQLVSITDVAWHAGNSRTNRHSIGIEHEGWTFRGEFTEAQYKASAELVAYLARRFSIPLDRAHIIGHHEVPNPYRRGMYGGIDGHQDPGPNWKWDHYLELIRAAAKTSEQPKYVKRMVIKPSTLPRLGGSSTVVSAAASHASSWKPPAERSVVDFGATVKSVAHWWAGIDANKRWRKGIYKAEFYVDGKLLWTDRLWPFAFRGGRGWDTRTVANGRHLLVVKGYGRRGYLSKRVIGVKVANPPLELAVSGAVAGGAVDGVARIAVTPNQPVDRIALYVDGRAVSRDGSAPYELIWDTHGAAEGPHDVMVYARSASGRRAAEQMEVVVANAAIVPDSLLLAWGAHDELLPAE